MKHHTTLVLACAANALMAQSPIPPPVSTDLNNGVPGTWTISTLSTTGWTWGANVGTAGSGGLIMDCGGCAGYQETVIWSPWLDLSNNPLIDLTFSCAIIGGSMMVPPPIFVMRDGVGGSSYEYRYGYPDLIPPPDEVIASTLNPFPPLDLGSVSWVNITYPFYAGLNNDSVRLGVATGVPLGGYALVDDIAIGGLATAVATTADTRPVVMQSSEAITVRSVVPLRAVDVVDLAGRVVSRTPLHGEREYTLRTQTLPEGAYLLRLQHGNGQAVVRVAW
jgi:hypothetical protein